MSCPQHPDYGVVRRPRVEPGRPGCTCWELWRAKVETDRERLGGTDRHVARRVLQARRAALSGGEE